jgi:hypothetical protein
VVSEVFEMKPKYYVYTYDADKEDYTPQAGVRCGPYSLFGLRRAIRKLRDAGYPCNYTRFGGGDPSVYITRVQSCAKNSNS